jgi:aryl-alcohol dehydrogenase-like predicted oxidoreductase
LTTPEENALRTRRLGRTGLEVSEISFGAWQLGNVDDWGVMHDATAHRLVHEALDRGINLFDTAPNYAATNSERLLGEALAGRRHGVVLVSKFGHPPRGPKDFSLSAFWSSLEGSLRRLRTGHVDVLLLHNPPAAMLDGTDALWEALAQARQQGKIRHFGVSLDRADEIEATLDHTESEVVEMLFNILNQDVRRAFPRLRNNDCGAIVKVPLDSGWLSGKYDTSSRFSGVRSRWTRDQIAQRAELVSRLHWLTDEGTRLALQALAFVLSYDEVSCVIPGIRTRDQLVENLQAVGRTLSPSDRIALEALWDEFSDGGRIGLPW